MYIILFNQSLLCSLYDFYFLWVNSFFFFPIVPPLDTFIRCLEFLDTGLMRYVWMLSFHGLGLLAGGWLHGDPAVLLVGPLNILSFFFGMSVLLKTIVHLVDGAQILAAGILRTDWEGHWHSLFGMQTITQFLFAGWHINFTFSSFSCLPSWSLLFQPLQRLNFLSPPGVVGDLFHGCGN